MRTARQFLAMMHKDVRHIYRRPVVFALLLLMPLLLIAVTSQAFEFMLGEAGLEVVAVDLDRSRRSERLLAELDRVEGVELRRAEWPGAAFDASSAQELLGGELGVVVVPAGFGGEPGGRAGSRPAFYVDPIQAGVAAAVRSRIEQVLMAGSLPGSLGEELGSGGAADPGSVEQVAARALAAPAVTVQTSMISEEQSFPSAFEQSVPGFSVMFGFWLAGYVALMLSQERMTWGTLPRSLVAPVPRWTVLGSRVTAYVGLGVGQLTVLFGAGKLIWGLELGDSLAALALVMTAVALVTACFGLVLNILARDILAQQMLSSLSVFVLGAVGGALVPVFLLPDWMAWLSPLTPHAWALGAFQDIMIRGHGIAEILPAAGVLAGFAVAFFSAAMLRFRFVG